MRSCHGTVLHQKGMLHMVIHENIKHRLMKQTAIDLKICSCT